MAPPSQGRGGEGEQPRPPRGCAVPPAGDRRPGCVPARGRAPAVPTASARAELPETSRFSADLVPNGFFILPPSSPPRSPAVFPASAPSTGLEMSLERGEGRVSLGCSEAAPTGGSQPSAALGTDAWGHRGHGHAGAASPSAGPRWCVRGLPFVGVFPAVLPWPGLCHLSLHLRPPRPGETLPRLSIPAVPLLSKAETPRNSCHRARSVAGAQG